MKPLSLSYRTVLSAEFSGREKTTIAYYGVGLSEKTGRLLSFISRLSLGTSIPSYLWVALLAEGLMNQNKAL